MQNQAIRHGSDAREINERILLIHQIQMMHNQKQLMLTKFKRILLREILKNSKGIFCRNRRITHNFIFKPRESLRMA